MSGSVDAAPGVLLGPLAEDLEPRHVPPPGPAATEARWSASRTLRKFAQLTFAYGVSASAASVSAVLMGVAGNDAGLFAIVALAPFLVSVVISGAVLTDLLELLWDGVVGRFPRSPGMGGWLWAATLFFLLTGVVAFAGGIALVVVAFGARPDDAALAPAAVAVLAVCGLSILTAVVLPPAALGPPRAQAWAVVAATLGGLAVTMEARVATNPPFGSDPLLGWMEGTFPLLNWNFGYGLMVAVSAFLVWRSYRMLPAIQGGTAVPA